MSDAEIKLIKEKEQLKNELKKIRQDIKANSLKLIAKEKEIKSQIKKLS